MKIEIIEEDCVLLIDNDDLDNHNFVDLTIIEEDGSGRSTMTISVKDLAAALLPFEAMRKERQHELIMESVQYDHPVSL